MNALRSLTLGLIFAIALSGLARAEDAAIAAFYGTYVGKATVENDGVSSERDLNVVVKPFRKGFTVEWTTVTRRAGGKTKRASYKINFRPSRREGIFASAMKINKFGKGVPLDPLKGDPYVWAKISGKTLTVHAMIILDDGGFEMQTYNRTLTDNGMSLDFERIRDGQPLRRIKASLERQGE